MAKVITVRINDDEEAILNQASSIHGMSKSSLMKLFTFEKIEDEYDLKVFKEYKNKKASGKIKTRPIDELWKETGL